MSRKERILSPQVAEAPPGMWSNCLKVGDSVYFSGLTARANDGTSIVGETSYEQAQYIFSKMKHLIEAAGGQMDDIVTLTVYVTDIKHNEGVWKARQEFFTGDFPACALVGVSQLAKPEILVEIQGQARLGAAG